MITLIQMGKLAKQAAKVLAMKHRKQKDAVLQRLAFLLALQQDTVLAANDIDVSNALMNGFSEAMVDRLRMTPERISSMAEDIRVISALDDPVGMVFDEKTMPNGLEVSKQRVPLGVIAVIYEARPNVTIDVSCLALKSGNAVILRGGKETLHTNTALVAIIHQALAEEKMPRAAIQFIDSPDRSLVEELLKMSDVIDMLIPRGGAHLHQYCRENSRIPVITGGIGICHLFVDASAAKEASLAIIHNAKTQRPSVCNALDTLLVHESIAKEFLLNAAERLIASGVSLRCDPIALEVLGGIDQKTLILPADELSFDTEWLSLILSIKVVKNMDEAIAHIQAHSTGHSDGILTENRQNAQQFVQSIDSAAVYVNASTRFTDGAQLGLGAEVAISTQRLHARGPMALEALTTYKWVIQGNYHTRP